MNNADILGVAKAQKGILFCVLGAILVLVLGLAVSSIFNILNLPLALVEIYFVYKLARALKSKYWILWIIGVLIPGLGLILLLVLNSRATKVLRANGQHVGLMGAKISDLQSKAS